jgi:phage-related protein
LFPVPQTDLVIYQESPDSVPLVDWLASLSANARSKCRLKIRRLAELGHGLRRPEADYLRDGIYELRIGHRKANYRILYTFVGHRIALLTHGIVKEDRVPPNEIDEAIRRKVKWESDPQTYTYKGVE